MLTLKEQEVWFVVGSQLLYGPEVLETVAKRGQEMAAFINADVKVPCKFIYKGTIKSNEEVSAIVKEANYDDNCAGIVTWCHTFSPSKMWINGLAHLQKPYCHFATQYHHDIPNDEIDMDFMNLNQAAHGDREHGFIGARMRLHRKVIVGHWKDESALKELGEWMRAAIGYKVSQNLSVVRFGDNMREVAVTEGDKVEAQIKLGWQVNTWPVGELANEIGKVTDEEVEAKVKEYEAEYKLDTDDVHAVHYQAKEEIAMERILQREHADAYTNTFQDLWGMEELPGLASQHLMVKGYGYGAEGDWKTAAMTHIIKVMTQGLEGGSSFMEDYTYHYEKDNEYVLGAHMLEICPSIAAVKPRIEVHPLGIGGKEAPARLVFEGHAGKAEVVSLIDIGGRLRLIVQDIECVKPIMDMPNLPVARVMWKIKPNLREGIRQWITAGGAHHTVLTYDATADMLADWAEMMDIELVHLTENTTTEALKKELRVNDLLWKLR
ncbi:MAG: L-arabinose isomerase [Chloroflexota bacterium]|nr:MAG: L-arabinose isomerase [Chloroflexota bacterium]